MEPIDKFKSMIRLALQAKLGMLRVVVDQVPVFAKTGALPSAAMEALPNQPAWTRPELTALIPQLIEGVPFGEGLEASLPRRGALTVNPIGQLLVTARGNPLTLLIFLPPNSEQMADDEWRQQMQAPQAPQPTRPAPPMPATYVVPESDEGAESFTPAMVRPVLQQQIPTAVPMGIPSEFSNAIQPGIASGIPSGFPSAIPSGIAMANPTAMPSSIPAQAQAPIPMPAPIPVSAPIPMPAPMPNYSAEQRAQPIPLATMTQTHATPAQVTRRERPARGNFDLDAYLIDMVKKRASDLHLTCGESPIMRIDGEITRVPNTPPMNQDDIAGALYAIMDDKNRDEFDEIHDTDFAYEISGVGRFRVNAFVDRNGIGSVIRHIPSKIPTAEELKLVPAILNFCKLSKGLVLVTGPTGSGKSTTLASMIDHINKNRADHIITVEDPIEFVHPQQRCLVNQREINRHTKSFARALKAALREDPDVVLIGEMRDLETIAIAIETAETGHLVFGTLHTTSAISTVDRMVDQFPADRQTQIRVMLSSSLKGVVSQMLLKKKGGGRIAAQEILVSSDAVSSLVREGKTQMIANHMTTQKSEGNQLLNEVLAKYVVDGIVDMNDAYIKSNDKNGFIEMLKRKGVNTASIEPQKKTA